MPKKTTDNKYTKVTTMQLTTIIVVIKYNASIPTQYQLYTRSTIRAHYAR